MNIYTAKQITEILQKEDITINLRKVRYYTQIKLVPQLELVGNKRVYTDKHLHHFRAILALSRTGASLTSIQEKLADLSLDDIKKIGEQLSILQTDRIFENETYKVSEDIFITLSPRVSGELKQEVINNVTKILKDNEKYD